MASGLMDKIKPSWRLRARRYLRGFWEGFRMPWQGLQFLLKNRDLWPFAVAPILLSLAITLVALGGAAVAAFYLLPWMHHWSYFESGIFGRITEIFAFLFVIAILLAITVGIYLLASGVLTGWFNERLAFRVELKLGTPPETLKQMPFRYQVTDAILDFLVVAGTALACFLVGCIPVVGLVGTGVNFYVDWFVMGYDYIDIPLALRGIRRADKRAFAKRHRPQVLGLGAIVFAMNFVPILGNVLLTTAAIGAVLLHHRLAEADANGSPSA